MHDRGVSGDGRGDRRRGALERHVDHVDLVGDLVDELAFEVRRSAHAGSPVLVLARIGLQERDQLLQILRRHRWIDGYHFGGDRGLRDWRELLDCIVGRLCLDDRLQQEVGRSDQEGVTVGRRVRDRDGAGAAARARAVLHEELLAERFAQLLGE
jgi:hypothetical protein